MECVLKTRCSLLCVFVIIWLIVSTVKNAKAVLIPTTSKRFVRGQYYQLFVDSTTNCIQCQSIMKQFLRRPHEVTGRPSVKEVQQATR